MTVKEKIKQLSVRRIELNYIRGKAQGAVYMAEQKLEEIDKEIEALLLKIKLLTEEHKRDENNIPFVDYGFSNG